MIKNDIRKEGALYSVPKNAGSSPLENSKVGGQYEKEVTRPTPCQVTALSWPLSVG